MACGVKVNDECEANQRSAGMLRPDACALVTLLNSVSVYSEQLSPHHRTSSDDILLQCQINVMRMMYGRIYVFFLFKI